MRVVIYISGGALQSAYADGPVDLTLVDADDLAAEGLNADQIQVALSVEANGLDPILWDRPPRAKVE